VAAFFALERTLADRRGVGHEPGARGQQPAPKPSRMDPRAKGGVHRYFPDGKTPLQSGWASHTTMNRRLIAQSGTFAVPGVLDMPIEENFARRDQENILAKIVLTNPCARWECGSFTA